MARAAGTRTSAPTRAGPQGAGAGGRGLDSGTGPGVRTHVEQNGSAVDTGGVAAPVAAATAGHAGKAKTPSCTRPRATRTPAGRRPADRRGALRGTDSGDRPRRRRTVPTRSEYAPADSHPKTGVRDICPGARRGLHAHSRLQFLRGHPGLQDRNPEGVAVGGGEFSRPQPAGPLRAIGPRLPASQQPVRDTKTRPMSSPEQSKSPATRETPSRGPAVTRPWTASAYGREPQPRTTIAGMPASTTQPVSCRRRVYRRG